MLTESGHYNLQWLCNQTTEVLRYEARVENLAGWNYRPRYWLLASLRQIRPAIFRTSDNFGDKLSVG